MAPASILLNDEIVRVYVGCWDQDGISRIGHIDLKASNPLEIINISQKPDLDIGRDGCFDENGVFPGHVNYQDGDVYLHYTGFQLGYKIRHYNFGGLAIALKQDNTRFNRYSESPILDRSDEGLFVRAGSSTIQVKDKFYTVYSAGSGWDKVGGKLRPKYDVYIQKTVDGKSFSKEGVKIVECDENIEHGLGRPQIIRIGEFYYVFYTRRMKSFKYFFGASRSKDLISWERIDDKIEGIKHSTDGFDSDMIYFPNVIETKYGIYLFYSGNNFGGGGLGVAKIEII